MTINTNKKRLIIASIITFVLLTITTINSANFFWEEIKSGGVLLTCAIALCVLTGLLIAFKIEFKSLTAEKLFSGTFFFLAPIFIMTMTECLNYIFVYDFTVSTFMWNYFLYLMIQSVFYVCTNRIRLSVIITAVVLYLFAFSNYVALTFRGSPFVPLDFLSISTAFDVADSYNLQITYNLIISALILFCVILMSMKVKFVSKGIRQLVLKYSVTIVTTSVVMFSFYTTDIFANMGLSADLWNQTRGYKNSGSVFNFWLNTKYLYMSEPKEYSSEKALSIANQASDSIVDVRVPNEKNPNIIAVMNETFSDLTVLGDLQTSEDVMPFVRNLTENTIKGTLNVSINGSGTSNSEFEFLTGNSMAFLPAGSNAYELYINEPTDSLVSILGEQGYSKTAIHPYYATGWRRDEVYPLLGFDDFLSIDDFDDADYIRQYVSDESNYDKVIELYEAKDEDESMFVFNVTMQNHGGYTKQYLNFTEDVSILNPVGEYKKATQYLSIMKESDRAFGEFIKYFENEEEPTIILMFGDHQPKIEAEFEEALFGKSLSELTLEETQKRYEVPFVIWANYDIEEQYIENISANYLSSLLLDTANLQTSQYNDYLANLHETLPVINAIGYQDNQGNWYSYDEESPYTDLIAEYKILQYNNIFDKENKLNDIFSVEK